jgi:hypothetical protein
MSVFGKTQEECFSSIDEIIQGDEVKQEKLNEFLKIQSGLTLHKLAYSMFGDGISKERFTLEGEILKHLEKMEDKKSDPEFKKVYDMFKSPSNSLSRNALAQVLPYIKDILNAQMDESDPVKKQLFGLDQSDIKMLVILAEKERKKANGNYHHLLSRNHSNDSSILNFTKIINSSIRNTDDSVANIRKTMARRLEKLQIKAKNLVNDIFLGTECESVLKSCVMDNNDKSMIINDKLLSGISLAVNKLDAFEKHKYLKYDDVWLYTKSGMKRNKKPTKEIIKQERTPVIKKQVNNQEQINNYLVQYVFEQLPYFFKREDLEKDPELTLALARAIDRGALKASKIEDRVFYYKGFEYQIPDLWNKSYSRFIMAPTNIVSTPILKDFGRIGQKINKVFTKISDKLDKTFFGKKDDMEIKYPVGFSDNQKKSFVALRNEQRDVHNSKTSFMFKDKLYLLDGTPIERNKEAIFLLKGKATTRKEAMNLSKDQQQAIVKQIAKENKSYIDPNDKTTRYISGTKVELDKAWSSGNQLFIKTNFVANEKRDKSKFPSKKEIHQIVDDNAEIKPEILKALADNRPVAVGENKAYNLILKKEISSNDAKKTIMKYRLGYGVKTTKKELNHSPSFLKSNAAAIINKEKTFNVDNQSFYTSTGDKVGIKKSSNTLFKDKISHKHTHDSIVKMNELSQKERVIAYNSKYPVRTCEYYTIVDKKNASVSVHSRNGISVFNREILLGKTIGDQRTLLKGSFENRATNNKTGAGLYYLGSKKAKHVSDYHSQFDGNYLTLDIETADGQKQAISGLHQVAKVTPERLAALNNNDTSDNRITSGGLSLDPASMKTYMSKYYEKGCPFYILSETSDVEFKVVGEQLVLKPTKRIKNSRDYYLTSFKQEKPKEIKIVINDERYLSDLSVEYMISIQDNKSQLMNHLGLTNDEYNEIAKIAFGVLGTETEFGTDKFFKFKESGLGQITIDYLKGNYLKGNSIGGISTVPAIPLSLLGIKSLNSRGPTQIKNAKQFKPKSLKLPADFDITTPRGSALATMLALASKYKSFKNIESKHRAITDRNRMDYLYYLYTGASKQIHSQSASVSQNAAVTKVKEYAKSIEIYQEP